MLTHTTGYGYFFNREENAWLVSVLARGSARRLLTLLEQMDNAEGGHDLGSMLYLNAPRVWESDKEWQ